MASDSSGTGAKSDREPRKHVEMIPREFLRVIAIWSLVPSYLVAGGLIGFLIDRMMGWFPYVTCVGLLVALVMSVRDMYRLHDEM
jgi:F0F1-type ATP synthase assembly protein I